MSELEKALVANQDLLKVCLEEKADLLKEVERLSIQVEALKRALLLK